MSKKDANEELTETKRNFLRFMEKYNKDPNRAHPKLTECERASLAHVDPDVILGEEEFYFRRRGECPTMDEYRIAHPTSGYPIKLPFGLKKLRSHDDPETIRAFADILGSLMQPTDRPPVDHLKTHEYTSSLTINMLTMNRGNLTRNPKLDCREVRNMAMKDRPIVKMHSSVLKRKNPENSSRRSSDSGTRPSLSSNGHPDQLHALSAAGLPQEWNYWQDTFPPRVSIGEPHSGCSDVSSETRKISLILNTYPTSDCLATTGPSMFTESKKYIGPRLPAYGRNKEIVVLHIEQSDECHGMLPKSSNNSLLEFDSRHATRADLPFGATFIPPSAMEQQGKIFRTKSCHSWHCTNVTRSLETPTNPRIPTADCSTSSIQPMVS